MDLGYKLRNARTQSNLTQEQVAEALGVSRQTISNWENDKTFPDIKSAVELSDLYDVSLDHLLKEEKVMSKYLEFLDESINVVKIKIKLSKYKIEENLKEYKKYQRASIDGSSFFVL